MRILFFCQYFPPEMGAPAARTYEHARYWASLGHEVTVVCGKPNHPDGIVPEHYRGPLLYREHMDGIEVLRCWLYATPNRGFFKRSIAFMTYMLTATWFGIFATRKPDVVVATSPQLLCALGGYAVALCKRAPFVFEVRDLWPKQIIDLGAVRNRVVIGLLESVEMMLYRRADAVVTVAPKTTEALLARGVPAEKLHTITNAIDPEFFKPGERMNALREEYGWGDKTVVMYIGTHGLSQGLSTIVETAAQLRHRDDLHFVFAGQGAERELLMKQAAELGVVNVTFLPIQPKDKMPQFYAAADICLVPLKRREYFRCNIPSKMFEIMACGRPIILGVEGQAREILEAAGAGVSVEPENPAAYRAAIEQLAADPAARAAYGAAGRAHVIAHYDRRRRADLYLHCLERAGGFPISVSAPSAAE